MTSKVSSNGKTYYLHSIVNKRGGRTFFFSSNPEGEVEMNDGYEIGENSRSKLPFIKKKVK